MRSKISIRNKSMKIIYTYHTDGGHGWLEVPRHMLFDLKIEHTITAFSYQRKDKVYLEEDMDMATFIDAMKAKDFEVGWVENYTATSPIRDYDHFQVEVK